MQFYLQFSGLVTKQLRVNLTLEWAVITSVTDTRGSELFKFEPARTVELSAFKTEDSLASWSSTSGEAHGVSRLTHGIAIAMREKRIAT